MRRQRTQHSTHVEMGTRGRRDAANPAPLAVRASPATYPPAGRTKQRALASVPHVALDALVAALALLVRDFAAPAFARPGTGTGPLALHGVWV